ncbi:MAG: hypothetical protein II299_02525 [Alistipes sp.]|nr:hypothetical protein [Alistipes sp.]
MVKKFLGYIVAIAVIAIIVFTVMGAGTYTSMLPEDLFSVEGTTPKLIDVKVSQDSIMLEEEVISVDTMNVDSAMLEEVDTTALEN